MKRFYMTAIMCLALSIPSLGWTQDAGEDMNKQEKDLQAQAQAIELMKEGFSFYNEREYARAIEKWMESYMMYPSGSAQLNIAQAYLELERFDEARVAVDTARGNRGYLALPLEQADLIDLQLIEREIDAREAEVKARQAQEAKAARIKACREGKGRLSRLGKGGLLSVGIGGAAMLGTIPFELKARRQLDALEPPHTEGREQYDVDAEALRKTQRNGKLFLYSGASVGLIGLGLFTFDMTTEEYPFEDCQNLIDSLGQDDESNASTMLHLAPGHVGISVRF